MEYGTAFVLVCLAGAATVAIITAMTTSLVLGKRHERQLNRVRRDRDRAVVLANEWREEAVKAQKPREITIHPGKVAISPMQEKLQSMVNATASRVGRHIRPAQMPTTTTDQLNNATIIPGGVTASAIIVAGDSVTPETSCPVIDTPSGNDSGGGSFSSDSSCAGGGE